MNSHLNTRRTDPGNPREGFLAPVHIYPGEGELAEYRVPLTVNGKEVPDGMLLDAAGCEDAKRIAREQMDANLVPRDNYEIGEPVATGGPVTWTGPRYKGE